MAGTIFVYAYNSMAAVLRGLGDSKTPMIIVIITVILNAFLDILLIAVIPLGVMGAALATIFCQFVSMILLGIHVKRKTDLFDFKPRSYRINKIYLGLILKIGLPQAIQFVFASSSFVFLSGLVNVYGVEASAAAGAAAKIQTISNLPSQGVMVGLMTMTAQNLAVGEPKRALRCMWAGMAASTAISLVIFGFCMIFPHAAFRIFTPEIAVASVGIGYLRCMAFSFVLESIMFYMFGLISGLGHTPVTMCCGILSAFAVRCGSAWLLGRTFALGFNGIGLAYNAGPVVSSLICVAFLLTDKWRCPGCKLVTPGASHSKLSAFCLPLHLLDNSRLFTVSFVCNFTFLKWVFAEPAQKALDPETSSPSSPFHFTKFPKIAIYAGYSFAQANTPHGQLFLTMRRIC